LSWKAGLLFAAIIVVRVGQQNRQPSDDNLSINHSSKRYHVTYLGE
jgi:hypothetical protein